jgi:hypothetical protein
LKQGHGTAGEDQAEFVQEHGGSGFVRPQELKIRPVL